MSFTVSFPENTEEVIDAIRGAIGRLITFQTQVAISGCVASGCSLDPISRKSTNSFCDTCGGDYFIPVYSGVLVSGHVTWQGADLIDWQTGGRLFEGDCRVQIKNTEANRNLVTTSGYILVDDRTLRIKRKIFRGVPDPNRIIIDLELNE